jgi:hypothetical protein
MKQILTLLALIPSLLFAQAVWNGTVNTDLPIVEIDTKDGAPILNKVNYVNMTFTLTDPNNPQQDAIIENIMGGIRGRGNTTWSYSKKPYRIKFDKKQSLFGLPEAKSWVLLAEYLDPTLMMNNAAFKLGDIFNLPYNHTYQYVQLYLNGEYRGIYGLTEQNQVGEGRVDIDENEGWFVEMSSEYDEDPRFRTRNYNLPIMIKSPEVGHSANNPAYDFVRKDINELCDSLASANFPESGYRDLIDINTFVDFLMINEIVLNSELWRLGSIYSYKNKNGKISMGPLWDFDMAFSYVGTGFTHFTSYSGRLGRHSFFNRFFEDPIFLVKYKERWNENYDKITAVSEFIGSTGAELAAVATENFKIWNTSNNYVQQIARMKEWWGYRCKWLNGELNKVEILPKNKTFAAQTFGYSEEISPQTFTLVAYGDMADLSAVFKNAESSEFEISTELEKEGTGNGGYLAKISVTPKKTLSVATYNDTLILSGINQDKEFKIKVPLTFEVVKEESGEYPGEEPSSSSVEEPSSSSVEEPSSNSDGGTPIRLQQLAISNQAVQTRNGINLTTANNATLEIYGIKGNRISRWNFSSGVYTIPLWHLPKGLYITKVSFGNEKQILFLKHNGEP